MTEAAVRKLEAEARAGADTVLVPLGDVEVEVLPIGEWRASGLRALREGDFDTWAAKCLSDEGLRAWDECDPTMSQVEEFFTAWSERTGQDPGKSPASRRSSRSTARR
jgi:hypothetical protein